jgi:hypothetical protein
MAQHKHFKLMALFLKDARVSETPWVFWQKRYSGDNAVPWTWRDCNEPPTWANDFEYRRKPRTIRIGEFDVPEPMRKAPMYDSDYFFPATLNGSLYDTTSWDGYSTDERRLLNGVCHATKEAAILHAIALISLTCTPERLAELKKLL